MEKGARAWQGSWQLDKSQHPPKTGETGFPSLKGVIFPASSRLDI